MNSGLPLLRARSEKTRVALIGECLIELNGMPFGSLHQTFGGDTLNTALYLARLSRLTIEVQYVTAVGTDTLSDGMLQRWQAEGIDTTLTLRDPARLPGLYLVQVDDRGERSFLYWRKDSAARYLLQHPGYDHVATELAKADLIYLSAISLAILPDGDRAKLLDQLTRLAAGGTAVIFDTNYRAALWPSADAARASVSALFPASQLLFVTYDDEQRLWGDRSPEATLTRLHAANAAFVVIKLGAAGCLFSNGATVVKIAAAPVAMVTDTTAAGDAFNAGFLAAWLKDHTPEDCCRAANALAGAVIQHRGAIIPASATPSFAQLLANRIAAGIAQ
jgi:2-dehydro-3-deoxygluconokinase